MFALRLMPPRKKARLGSTSGAGLASVIAADAPAASNVCQVPPVQRDVCHLLEVMFSIFDFVQHFVIS